ncbi:MAG TPA: alginate lyase family protein [Planctomycetota bacterium]|nr:alginate lyase family protein [Planctomycetota bacterium]
MKHAFRFLRSLGHHTPAQLGRRAWSLSTRHALVLVQRRLPIERLIHGRDAPPFAKSLPLSLFEPRVPSPVDSEPRLELPMNWHPGSQQTSLLATMQLHYMEWLKDQSDERAQAFIRDWILNVRPYRPGYWRDSWNPYSISLRCVVWMQLFARRGDAWPDDFKHLLRESLFAQLRFLSANVELDIGGNHLIKNIVALLWAGRLFDGPKARRFTIRGERLLERELSRQILDGGMHFERSPAYHAQVFADLCECLQLIAPGTLHTRLEAELGAMAKALADLTHPDGQVSLFNDGGLHMAHSPAECLDAFERASGHRPTQARVFRFDQAGFFGVRDATSLVLVDCGAIAADHLPAHGHGDALAFEWSLDGKRFIVDAGVSEYAPGPRRDWSRSTRAHNTLTLDNQDQCEFYSSFRIGRRARVALERFEVIGKGFLLIGSHDGFAHLPGKPIHRREIAATPRRIQVVDRVEGGSGQSMCARLLLHPDVHFERRGRTLILTRDQTIVQLDCDHPVTVEDSWWSPDFGVRLATQQLAIWYGAAPGCGSFALQCAPALAQAPQELVANPELLDTAA